LAKGDKVKMKALDFTKKGDNDMIDIILPDGSKTQVKKRILLATI
jgi:hypothetical protein